MLGVQVVEAVGQFQLALDLHVLSQVFLLLPDKVQHLLHLVVFQHFLLGDFLLGYCLFDEFVGFLLRDVLESFLGGSLGTRIFSLFQVVYQFLLDA